MEYNVVNKANNDKGAINKVISQMLSSYSRQLYNFTKKEFDSLVEHDVLCILAFYYKKMNFEQKVRISQEAGKLLSLDEVEDFIDEIYDDITEDIFVPLSCKLIDRLGDSRMTMIIFESIFLCCKKVTVDGWNIKNKYANYLALLNAAYFNALAHKLHVRESYRTCLKEYYGHISYDDLIEALYEENLDNLGWDSEVELDVLDELIDEGKRNPNFDSAMESDYSYSIAGMEEIRVEHNKSLLDTDERVYGFDAILKKTGIRHRMTQNVHGFECHFCDAKNGSDEYIIVYQKENRISDLIEKVEAWNQFQHDLYYADIKDGKSSGMVYIVYILDSDSSNIPIQTIESNRTYGRKYVFTEEETVTFINGIVKTTSDEISEASPVQEWDRILREEHLTGCMTEVYSSKKVEAYLSGERFDADYVMDDDYAMMTKSVVPHIKWVKSLDTKGFRDFCFDDKTMEFGQINLFYGANGSGKTSVLEAIEYALTSEVRRVKDFKVKLPTTMYPRLRVYDREAGVHTFYPENSKKNAKEIERVWYGVPVGRTKTNLNENFNRFNSFDSEAAYKFIHESDNSEETYASMFGNLMFGESVVDHEKKWQRFKKAFNDRYSELRSELNEARSMAEIYERSLAQRNTVSKAEAVEDGMLKVGLKSRARLPRETVERYRKLLEELTLVRKYIDLLSGYHGVERSLSQIERDIAAVKANNQKYVRERKEKNDSITSLAESTGIIKKSIFSEREKLSEAEKELSRISTDIRNWEIVQNVLSHKDTIQLVNDLLDELTQIERELYYLSKLEQRPAVISFLRLDSYAQLSDAELENLETEFTTLKNKKNALENQFEEAKKRFGEKEQKTIELRKLGKTLLVDAKCPLCGQEYESAQGLLNIIDSAVSVDDEVEALIIEIQTVSEEIAEIEKKLERERLIRKAIFELAQLRDSIPVVERFGDDYRALYEYVCSKTDKEKRKAEIVEQQTTLDGQGFSLKNINACKEYTSTDTTYLAFKRQAAFATYAEFLNARLADNERERAKIQQNIELYEEKIKQNGQKEELLRTDIHRLDSLLEGLGIDANRELEQAVENIKTRFEISSETQFKIWSTRYYDLYDKCELEVERLEAQDSVEFEKRCLAEYRAVIKRNEPMVARCASAVQVFEKMPSLSSFVERGIRSNIQQISKFFKWMHHSGEFEELGIDEGGIYAIRGLNQEKIRTYQMSTGQRSTIAMAVMFALHMAAPDAPQFLLLDEPLATMDDTQVLNVLDILKSMAEQNTQIFFTTANGIMIKLFKECFKNTDFDYKEYEFVKRVNRPSEIKEHNINDVKTIEELTLDDLTLDFNQFAQIREILRKNQEKLVPKEEWEISSDNEIASESIEEPSSEDSESFVSLLTEEEKAVLEILRDSCIGNYSPISNLIKIRNHKVIIERINEKAMDYFGETIIDNDSVIPKLDEDYASELGI